MKEYTGRTLDEVLNSIAAEQGCQVQDITYNVLEEEKGGIFGLHKSVTIEAFTSKDVKEFIFDYLGAYFTELNQGVAIEIIATVLKAAVNATFKKRINLIVDVNHYKEDRYKKVKAIARREAINVAKSHVDCELDPMPNDERKVIHQYLQDFRNVTTVSVGEGNKRHLVIKYSPDKKEEAEEE